MSKSRLYSLTRPRPGPQPDASDPKDWNVTRKPAGVSQLYLTDSEDSRRALALARRAGLPVHQVQTGDILDGLPGPVLDTRHRTLVGLGEIMRWLARLAAVKNGSHD